MESIKRQRSLGRILSVVIFVLGLGILFASFWGQSEVFYQWRSNSIELRKFEPPDKATAEAFHRTIWEGLPRGTEWIIIRYLSVAVSMAAIVAFWVQRKRNNSN